MSEPKPSWDDLVEQHRRAFHMSEEDAAAVWEKIVRAHPEADQLVLLRRRSFDAPGGHGVRWLRPAPAVGAGILCVLFVGAAMAARGAKNRAERSESRAEQSEAVLERGVTLLEAQAELQQPSHAQEAMYAARPAAGGDARPPRGRGAAHAAWTRCREAYDRSELAEAQRLCDAAKAADSTYPPIYNTLGRIEAERGNRDAAEELYQQALARDPNYVPALLGLSTCKILRRDLDGAEKAVIRALDLAPENERAGKLAARIRELRSKAP